VRCCFLNDFLVLFARNVIMSVKKQITKISVFYFFETIHFLGKIEE